MSRSGKGDGDDLAGASREMPGAHDSMYFGDDIPMGDHKAPKKVHNGMGTKPLPTK